jgi:RNA polymerase sigma factor (sigma-70 family)
MANGQMNPVLQHIRKLAHAGDGAAELTDRELLERFTAGHEEPVFEALVERHGPLVLAVCRRVLQHEQDAEDAFQATFLVLARKAGSIRKHASVGSWLFGVAYRLALKARAGASRRHARERRFAVMSPTQSQPRESLEDIRPILDEELHRLPEKYRAPLVLCYLEGKTHVEAARTLGWPSGSMTKRLQRAREMLRVRLSRRGLALSGGLLATMLAESARAAVPAALVQSSVRAALLSATGQALAGTVSAEAASLAEGVFETMLLTKVKVWMVLLVTLTALAAGALLAAHREDQQPQEARENDAAQPAATQMPADLALVPGEAMGFLRISLRDLWNLKAVKDSRQQGGKLTAELVGQVEKEIGVSLDDIERVTLIVLPPGLATQAPVAEPGLLVAFTTIRPYAKDKIKNALVPGGTEAQHEGKTYIAPKMQDKQALYFVNERLFLMGYPADLKAYLELKAGAKMPTSLTRAMSLASGKHHLVGWLQVPESLAQKAREEPLPEAIAFARPLLDVQSGSLTVDVDNEARLRLKLQLPDEAQAKQAQAAVDTGLQTLKQFIQQVPQEARNDPLVVTLIGLGEDALDNTSIAREQSSIVVTAQIKVEGVLASLVPSLAKIRTSASRMQSANNLKQIALAMHNYHDAYKHLPPAAITDKDGVPLLSWRVAILPFVEGEALYKQFHLNEPWDSDHNKKLLEKMPRLYEPANVKTKEKYVTYYKVFTGKSTPFEDPNGNRIADITDGTSNTVLVVEGDGPVPWTKPEELPFDPDKALPKLGGMFTEGFNAAFCDGSVHFISHRAREKVLRALITRNGGEVINFKDLP